MKKLIILLLLAAVMFMVGCEGTQKAVYDAKADIVGADRTVTAYHPMTGTILGTWSDTSLRFERPDSRTVSLWLGDDNKKVYLANATVVIVDN